MILYLQRSVIESRRWDGDSNGDEDYNVNNNGEQENKWYDGRDGSNKNDEY